MQGIELSRRFYLDVVRPWLVEAAPGLPHAAALIGYGSELLGFDDETSKDHNWGPRLQLIVSATDFSVHASRLIAAFADAAPAEFLGEPIGWRSRPHPPVTGPQSIGSERHGVEIHTLEALVSQTTGLGSTSDLGAFDWLGIAEQRLIAFTAGAVFHDDVGALTQARARLAYYPDDVWYFRIACQWGRIAEEQAFVGRAGQVGDDLGSRVVAARLARDVMRLAFLLERRYAPYSKWLGTAFAQLPVGKALAPHLQIALASSDWEARAAALAAAYLALAQYQQTAGIAPFVPKIGPYFSRPFLTINADDAVAAARAAVVDPVLGALPTIGALDQISDLTPVLERPDWSAALVAALLQAAQSGVSSPS